ncbi:abc transporter i family member 6 [Quercus suber]|uniref:Abc transporter i family member 6 n=1 Tax=Quercus suber TaxID=58331 RepID=A0AAW0JHX2_QUESU
MEEMMKVEDPHDQVAGVVYDGFMPFAHAVANNLKLPGINVQSLAQAPVPYLQSLDLKGLLGSTEIPTPMLERRATVTDATKKASAIIVNTMHFLERQTLTKVQEHYPSPVFSVGPFHKLAPSASSSLLKEDTNLLFLINEMEFKFYGYIFPKLELVNMKADFLNRNVNEGFSGGERKRNEILQLAVLGADLAILDEIDSGLDVDALRDVAAAVNGLLTPKNSVLMITHYARLLNIIKPTYIHVMEDGKILRTGDSSIAKLLEDEGYQAISEISYLKGSWKLIATKNPKLQLT